MFRTIRVLWVVLALAGLSAAQEPELAGPVAGLVFDAAAGAIRPVVGVPGAAYLGAPVAAGLEGASISRDGKLAVALRGGRLFLVKGVDGAQPEWLDLEAGAAALSLVSWNADAAAVCASGEVLIWSAAEGIRRTSVSDLGEVAALALLPSGEAAVAAPGGVYLVSRAGSRLVAAVEQVSALAPAGADLFVASRARNEILRIRGVRDSAGAEFFAGESQGVAAPAGIAWSAARNALLVALARDRRVLALPAGSGASSAVDLDFEPSRLEPFSGTLFFLNSPAKPGEALQLLDGGRDLAAYFVPAQSASEGQ